MPLCQKHYPFRLFKLLKSRNLGIKIFAGLQAGGPGEAVVPGRAQPPQVGDEGEGAAAAAASSCHRGEDGGAGASEGAVRGAEEAGAGAAGIHGPAHTAAVTFTDHDTINDSLSFLLLIPSVILC